MYFYLLCLILYLDSHLILYLDSPKHRLFKKRLNLSSDTTLLVTPPFPIRPGMADPNRVRGATLYCTLLGLTYLFFFFFFLRAELVLVIIQTISVITKNHFHLQKNYHRSGVLQNLYTYTESHLLLQTLILIHV